MDTAQLHVIPPKLGVISRWNLNRVKYMEHHEDYHTT